MRSARSPLRQVAVAATLSLIATACDVPDRAVGPLEPPQSPQLAASSAGMLGPTLSYRKAVTVEAIRAHQAAFQAIADQHGGVRSSISASHDATAEYVRAQMAAAGYDVSLQTFQFPFNGDLTAPVLLRVSPAPASFTPGADFASMSYSASGDMTGLMRAVDLQIPSTGASTSGCEAADFAGFAPGSIALMQRGTCEFRVKVLNAAAAGAVAAIIMNEGNTAERTGLLSGTVGPPLVTIPAVGTTFPLGVALANGVLNGSTGAVVRVRVDAAIGTATSSNVIAESRNGNSNSVVVVGANLDGRFGPGINATSGGAVMLELARVFAAQERDPKNRMRFIWFGAYPEGLHGAAYYLSQLTDAQRGGISAMIDIQPAGSPNFGRFVLDGDFSEFSIPSVPPNPSVDAVSGDIEKLFADYFTASGLPFARNLGAGGTGITFRNVGIPFGGLNTGFNTAKTAQEAALFGGTAGALFDACVWLPCDTFANVNTTALDQMSDAAAHVVLLLSRRNFAQKVN